MIETSAAVEPRSAGDYGGNNLPVDGGRGRIAPLAARKKDYPFGGGTSKQHPAGADGGGEAHEHGEQGKRVGLVRHRHRQ